MPLKTGDHWLRQLLVAGWLALAFSNLPGTAQAAEGAPAFDADGLPLFYGLADHFTHAFTGPRLLAQVSGVATTLVLTTAGTDAAVHRSFGSGGANAWADSAITLGYALVPAAGGALYLASKWASSDELRGAAWAGVQAGVLAVIYVSVIKFITGRPQPDPYGGPATDAEVDRQSRQFRWGFDRGGIIDGWPSSHTIVTSAFTSAIAAYYDTPWAWSAAVATTTYVGVGMTAARGSTQHWFSDAVAGALMGYALGSSVGEGFRAGRIGEIKDSTLSPSAARTRTWSWSAWPVDGGIGAQISWSLGPS